MRTFGLLRRLAAAAMLVCILSLAVTAGNWRDEFEDICAKVETADSLSSEDLAQLISRADEVSQQIDASADPARKVYMMRLKKCRDFFEFTLQSRGAGQ